MSLHVRRLAIRNYRSIARADLRLGQITVVIGPSDSGKSNLVRALRDLFFNASGADMVTKGGSVTRVALAVGRDLKVVWEKTVEGSARKRIGRYLTVTDAGESRSYEKIGLTVPAEVSDATAVREVSIDDLKIRPQVAEQAEPWFLLSPTAWTPGRVSKVVAKVSGIDALVLADRDLNSRRISCAREAREARTRAEAAEASLVEFEGLDDLDGKVRKLEALDASVRDLRSKAARAVDLVRALKESRRRRSRASERAEALQAVSDEIDRLGLSESLERHGAARSLQGQVEGLRLRLREARAKIKEARATLKTLAGSLDGVDSECPACGGDPHPECLENLTARAEGSGKAET